MENKRAVKGTTIYRNGYWVAQPDYTAAKLSDDIELLSKLRKCLSDVEGQDYARHAVMEHLFGVMRKANKSGPAAIFVFAGPPAVGKTLLAQKIGEALGCPFERFDMSGYSDKEAPINLFGLNKSYKSAAPGRLTSYIKEHPISVILLDEIEKAHVTVRNNILQMLDKGAVYDLFCECEFSVRDCIIIFTTNVGTNVYNQGNPYQLSVTPMPTVIKALEEEKNPATGEPYFSRELVSRFASGKIIVFNKLRPEVLQRIAALHIADLRRYYYREYNIGMKIDILELTNAILFSQGGDADVRSAIRASKEFFTKTFERVVEMAGRHGCGGRICGIRYHIDLSSASASAAEILDNREHACILSFGGGILGGIPKAKRARISVVSADSSLDVHAIKRLDPAIAVLGVTRKTAAKAKALFDNLIAARVPTYVYTKDHDMLLTYYEENGAVDCLAAYGQMLFHGWVADAVRGIDLCRAAERLFRANKVITFSTSYRYSKRSCIADVTLSDFATQIAYGGGESALFAGRAAIPDVTFDDVIGADEAKQELTPIIRQLKNYHAYRRNGIRIPRGVILNGPPGSGKTSIAKAVANAAGLPFISLNATEFLSKWVGEGEQKIRDIFAAARRYAPSIIFIDEIDCIAKDRMGDSGGASRTDGLTNALLSELDGFYSQGAAPVFVIAATNFDTQSGDGKLDKALLRRFDKKIHIGLPKMCEREQFLIRELARYDFCTVSRDAISSIAKRSVDWSLADLNLVVQNAVRHSESDNGFSLTDEVLNEAFASFNAGGKRAYDEDAVRKTAYHEAGHAVIAMRLGLNLAYTTIAARGGYGGYMQYTEEDKFDLTREECLNRICVALAGRAAEVCFYERDGITTGASGDIRSAATMAMRMICVYGMEQDMLCYMDRKEASDNAEVRERVHQMLLKQYERALQLVRDNADRVNAVAQALIEHESLTDSELAELISFA